jgi:hypothetical protein
MSSTRIPFVASLVAVLLILACNGSINVPHPDGGDGDADADSGESCPGGCPAGQVCSHGVCVATCSGTTGCEPPFECCNNTCVNIRQDPNNCGSCGNACAPYGDGCVGGVCSCNGAMACAAPTICCGTDGCIDPDTNSRHCGGCNHPCDGNCTDGTCETCSADPHEAAGGNTCADAEPLGTLVDTGDQQVMTGNLFPDGDQDCYWFTAQDAEDTTCDTFHVDIRFVDNPGDQFGIQIFRGSCEAPECAAETFTEYSWTTDFHGEIEGEVRGECPCRAEPAADANACSDNTGVFRFCVVRVAGTSADCATYEVEVSNGVYHTGE